MESEKTPYLKPIYKIGHVITRLIIGGAQENTVTTVLGLQKVNGIEVDLISGKEMGPEGRLDISGVKNLIWIPSLVRNIRPIKDLITLVQLKNLFLKKKYDCIHTHSSKAGILGRLAAAWAKVPLIIHTVHGLPFDTYRNPLENFIFTFLEKWASRVTDHMVVVSESLKNEALRKGIGRPQIYTTIPSGMDLSVFLENLSKKNEMRQQFQIPKDAYVVGKIARLFPMKGHEDVLKIAPALVEKFPNLIFLFVGDGILKSKLETEIKTLGLEKHFIFTGLLKPGQIANCIATMDLLVHASYREGLPRVLVQALSAQVPAISYDIGGAKEVIQNGKNGYLIPAGNLPELQGSQT